MSLMPPRPTREEKRLREQLNSLDADRMRVGVELSAALDALADLRDRLDRALSASESHQAARGRATNAAQAQLACMERARDVLYRLGELDEAARVEAGIRTLQEACRGQ